MKLTSLLAIAAGCGVNVGALLPRPRAPKQPDPPEVIEAKRERHREKMARRAARNQKENP
jgi:hypothetical protein